MATEQTSDRAGQPNPEDEANVSDYEEDDEPKKPKQEQEDVADPEIEKLVTHFLEESRDLQGDPYVTYVEQLEMRYDGMIDYIYQKWNELDKKPFWAEVSKAYKAYTALELQQLRYQQANVHDKIYDGVEKGGVRKWRDGSEKEVDDAMESSRANILTLLGDRSDKIKLLQLFESVKKGLPAYESPKKEKRGRAPKKAQPVKNQAYFESIHGDARIKAVVEDWRSIWKKELSGILEMFTSDMREVQMAEILQKNLFPQWLERYGKADILPSDILKDGKGNPYASNKKAISSKFKASKMKLPKFMVGGPTSPAQAIKIEFINALRNSDANYRKHRTHGSRRREVAKCSIKKKWYSINRGGIEN